MSENSCRNINHYDKVHTKAIESLDGIEKHWKETLRKSQDQCRDALERSQKETAETLIQSHEKYYTFSLELQKKNQLTLDKLHLTLSLAYNSAIQAISQELQGNLDAIKAKDLEFKALEDVKAKQLKDLQTSKANELSVLQESEAHKLFASKIGA